MKNLRKSNIQGSFDLFTLTSLTLSRSERLYAIYKAVIEENPGLHSKIHESYRKGDDTHILAISAEVSYCLVYSPF